MLYLWGKLISVNIFRVNWPIKVEFGIEDLHVTPLCNCKLCESQYRESRNLLTDVQEVLPLLCEVFFLILTKYDILKCINLMTISLMIIGVVKSILYIWVFRKFFPNVFHSFSNTQSKLSACNVVKYLSLSSKLAQKRICVPYKGK
jgi:hypothetical protein